MEILSSFLSAILGLCCPGSGCTGRSKMSVVTSCAAFSDIGALLRVTSLALRSLHSAEPTSAHGGRRVFAGSAGAHPKAALWRRISRRRPGLSAAVCGSSEALGVFFVSLIFATSFCYGNTRIISLASWTAAASLCLLFPLLLLSGFKSHQLAGRHLDEVTSCKTPEYPQGRKPLQMLPPGKSFRVHRKMIQFWKQSHYFHSTVHLTMEQDDGDNYWSVRCLKSFILE